MNALLNAHTKRGCDSPPHIGFASNVSPEAQSSQTGVSSEIVSMYALLQRNSVTIKVEIKYE